MSECELRERMTLHGRSLFERGYGCGTSGNISVRLEEGFLITPTNTCLGRLGPDRISHIGADGTHLSGDPPSKEVPLHLAVYDSRPDARAVVHLHSTHGVAVSCLADLDPERVLPPLTPYFVMRIGELGLVLYARPGSRELGESARRAATRHSALLLANHGPLVAGADLDSAVYAAEEVEEACRVFLLLRGREVRPLGEAEVAELRAPTTR